MGLSKEENPLVNCNFLLRVDAVWDLPCKKIGSFKSENEYETIQEGGVNDYVHLRKKPVSKPNTFDVERYIGVNYFDPLPIGRHPVLPIILYVSRYTNDFKTPKRTFTFTGCTVMSKTYGELDAEHSGLILETTTIAYQRVLVVNDVLDDPMPNWSFDSTGRKMEGMGKRMAQRNFQEVRKSEMIKNSRTWNGARSGNRIKDLMM